MKRNGVILLITLSFIALVTTIVALYYALVESSIERNEKSKFLVQANLFMYDIKHSVLPLFDETVNALFQGPLIEEFLKNNEDFDKDRIKIDVYNQYVYGLPLPLKGTNANFGDATIKCNPGNRVLNINKYKDINDTFRYIYDDNLMNFLMNEYKVLSPDTLLDLIRYVLAVTPKDQSYFYGKDELKVNRISKDGVTIGGWQTWNMILDDYYSLTEDKKIYDVPWDKIVGFEGDFVDFNQIAPQLCKIIFPASSQSRDDLCIEGSKNIKEESVLDGLEENERTFLYGANLFFDFNTILDCRLDYSSSNVDGSFTFRYFMEKKVDANTTKAAKIEDFKMVLR